MGPLLWLLAALAAGGVALMIAWPTWNEYRSRSVRDANAERYLAWRGRARRDAGRSQPALTSVDRRRFMAAAALGAVSLAALVAFFVASG